MVHTEAIIKIFYSKYFVSDKDFTRNKNQNVPYSVLRYNNILKPMISNIDNITIIPPSPPISNPILLRICEKGIAEETNNERSVLTEKIE